MFIAKADILFICLLVFIGIFSFLHTDLRLAKTPSTYFSFSCNHEEKKKNHKLLFNIMEHLCFPFGAIPISMLVQFLSLTC